MKTAKQLVDEAMQQIVTLALPEAQALLIDADALFVDLRDVRELEREGVIPGAFHAPRGLLEFWVDPQSEYFKPVFGQGKRVVLFCAVGWRSALAAKTLQDMGRKSWQLVVSANAPASRSPRSVFMVRIPS